MCLCMVFYAPKRKGHWSLLSRFLRLWPSSVASSQQRFVTMIDAIFRLLAATRCCILRHEMTKLAGNDMVQ